MWGPACGHWCIYEVVLGQTRDQPHCTGTFVRWLCIRIWGSAEQGGQRHLLRGLEACLHSEQLCDISSLGLRVLSVKWSR